MLSETDFEGGDVRALVIGLGCNLTADGYPAALEAEAVSCEEIVGDPVDRDTLLEAFLDVFARRLVDLDAVPAAARAASATLGRHVRVEMDRRPPLVGEAVAITDSGGLVVRDDGGTDHTIATGDVVHLRPGRAEDDRE